ncbi:hypothetical protein [Burkholderia glumae]|uniref:Uncharacterized protein n=1 Tax=Burkholderia glumae TaxID=337 RepID=A0ABY5BAS4_BURGL|nr:hypothetical protein [Burkholderia glumae]USS44120.1 hypothetical protein NFI99_12575 [Burkholderia glumae]UVT05836.1 hypothetical protein EFP20_30215 [Burkholderia glumae]
MEQAKEKVVKYLERVRAFETEVRRWCEARQLTIVEHTADLFEPFVEKYQAPALKVLLGDGSQIAELVPAGSNIIGALGRIDLIGRMARHPFLFYSGKGPAIAINVAGQPGPTPQPIVAGIDGEGWYWLETSITRAKRVDETLFIDLLSDATDHEFQ